MSRRTKNFSGASRWISAQTTVLHAQPTSELKRFRPEKDPQFAELYFSVWTLFAHQ